MAGNSQRRGAVRNAGSKKGATVGTGGHARKGLRGKGPTPKAEDRPNHKAFKAAKAAARSGRGAGTRPQQRSPQERRAASEIVAGRNAVVEALRAEVPCKTLYVATRIDSDDRVREALKLAADRHVPVLETPRAELDRLTAGAIHQGLAMQMPPYEYVHPQDLLHQEIAGAPLIVALDGITDSRNLGAIVRSAAAFGGHGVVVPERRSAHMSAGAWKTSAGAAARIPVALAGNLNRALEDYKKAGCFVIGLDMEGDVELPSLDVDRQTPLVVVVGSEGKGLSRLVRENCDQIVSVPMSGAMESLNAGIAAAVTLYEIHARRARLR